MDRDPASSGQTRVSLICVRHIIIWQALGEGTHITTAEYEEAEAVTVYGGEALCSAHLNTVRGHEPDYRIVQVLA